MFQVPYSQPTIPTSGWSAEGGDQPQPTAGQSKVEKAGKFQEKGFTQHHLSSESGAGFTLIEAIVAIAVFLIIISITSGIFVSLVGHQKRAMAYQELLSQTSYVIEYMSRALRMAKRTTDNNCLSAAGLNYENPGSDISKIRFINYSESNICQEFSLSLSGEQLEESKDGGASFTSLTSDKFQINSLKFELSGESGADILQPRVTIFLEIQVKGEVGQPKIQIQTTISQTNLDI